MTLPRTLVVACSATKRPHPWPMPAWQRYDGPMWQTLRKHWSPEDTGTELWVLSAGHGLIPASFHIRPYDRTMKGRAKRMAYIDGFLKSSPTWAEWWMQQEDMRAVFRDMLLRWEANEHEMLVVAGEHYREVLDRWAAGRRYPHTTGGIGTQRHQLANWLQDTGTEREAA